MSKHIADIDGDTIEVRAFEKHPRTARPFVSVSVEHIDGTLAAVHLDPSAVRALIAELELSVKNDGTAEPQHECPVCSEAVANENDLCPDHTGWIGCGQCGELHPADDLHLSKQDGTFCPGCLHNARRSGWDG